MSNSTGNKQRLLIVDDSKVIRVTARKILRDHFETVEAVDGENAWEILSSEAQFSVVVSDLTMPNLDGFGLLERIRNSHQPHIRDLPVIVITGANDSEAVKQRASGVGATDFIGKPFDSVHLLARTQAHASAKAAARSLTEKMIELEDRSLVDPLTGLSNEMAFMDRGYQQLSYAIRHDTSLSIFRIGIDHYGKLYKQHGEETTEAAIKTVASVLQGCIRNEDLVARTGTAHFSLLLPGMNKYGIRNLAGRISRDLDGRIVKHDGKRIHISVSIGIVAQDIRRDTRFEDLLKLANKRLFQAIKQGGNQVVFDDSDSAAAGHAAGHVTAITVEEITEMITQATDNGQELEEIVLTAPVMEAGQDTDSSAGLTVIENRSTESPGNPSPASATPAAPGRRAVFTIDESDNGQVASMAGTTPVDTELNTGESHRDAPAIAVPAAAIPTEQSPAPLDKPGIPVAAGQTDRPLDPPATEAGKDSETEEPPSRPGMCRRMLRGIGRLFGGR